MSGAPMKARDVADAVSRTSGRTVQPSSVSAVLARISDPSRSDLGNFIRKRKSGNAWVYTLTMAAQALTEAQAYGLSQKTGPDRYTLAQALRDYPGLQKEIAPPEGRRPVFHIMRKAVDTVRPRRRVAVTARKDPRPAEHPIELSIRYSSKYTLSIASSLKTFILLCIAAVLAIAAGSMVVYAFFLPALLLAGAAAVGWLGWRLFFAPSTRS
jgi:hypothetical protein